MELDNLKQAWQHATVHKTTNKDIMELIQHRSKGPVAELMRSYRKEMAMMGLMPSVLLLTNVTDVEGVLRSVLFWTYVAVCIGIILFAYSNYRIASRMQSMEGIVKSNLEGLILLLETRMRQKMIGVRVVMGLFIVLLEVLPYYQDYMLLRKWHELSTAIRFGSYAALFALKYFISRSVVQQRRFGRHISHLKELAKEME